MREFGHNDAIDHAIAQCLLRDRPRKLYPGNQTVIFLRELLTWRLFPDVQGTYSGQINLLKFSNSMRDSNLNLVVLIWFLRNTEE